MPSWLTSGPVPILLAVFALFAIIYLLVYFRLSRVQRDLHTLGRSFYDKERLIQDDLKAGRITRAEYRRAHGRLVQRMREESRKITDGPQI